MKKHCIAFLFSLISVSLNAQYNMLVNPSFEIIDTCPPFVAGALNNASPWTRPLYPSSPDVMNACDTFSGFLGVPQNVEGYELARTGVGYAFIVTYTHGPNQLYWNYRECLQTPLTDSLIAGVEYCIRFYVSAADSMRYVSNNIGVYFSPVEVHDTCVPIFIQCILQYVPQFENPPTNNLNSRNGWTLVSGSYIATGGEKYIIIGNFRDSAATVATFTGWSSNLGYYSLAAYYIDDVLITPCDSLTGYFESERSKQNIKIIPAITDNKIDITSENEFIKEVTIYTMEGKTVYRKKQNSKVKEIAIDVSLYYKGIYITSVVTAKGNYYLKFIKY